MPKLDIPKLGLGNEKGFETPSKGEGEQYVFGMKLNLKALGEGLDLK